MADINLDALYERYRGVVESRVYSAIGEETQNIEDVVSEIFLDFTRFIKSGKFKGNSSPQTVLFTITQRRIADFFRKISKERVDTLKAAREIADNIQAGPEKTLYDFEWRTLFSKVIDALDTLTEREREVFLFRGVSEMDATSLAEKLGVPEGSIKKLYADAKKKLAVAIKDAVNNHASVLSNAEKKDWLDRFYFAYLCLGEKHDKLSDSKKLIAAQAYKAIVLGFDGDKNLRRRK